MLTISNGKAFSILCLICLCGNREYPGRFQNKLLSSSFKQVSKYILFLDKLKIEGRPFWNLCVDFTSLTCGDNVKYYKSVHLPISNLENSEHPGNFENKSVSSPFIWVSRYILFLAKLKGRGMPYFKGCNKRDCILRLPLRALGCHKRWKSICFCQIWNNPTAPSQNLHQSSVPSNISPLYLFRSNIIYFDQKESKVHIFEAFKCSGQN